MTPPTPGRVIVLNGTSSAGKSTLAAELLALLPEPHLFLRIDDYYAAMHWPDRTDDAVVEATLPRLQAGFHRTVAAMAAAGNHVLVDQVLSRPWRLPDLLTALDGLDTVLVGVHCDPGELTRRERARGDRPIGQATAILPVVHAHGLYDVEVDTTDTPPATCAATIATHLTTRPPGPTACARLRERYRAERTRG